MYNVSKINRPFIYEINHLLNDVLHSNFSANIPAFNIVENKDNFSIEINAPGFEKENFSIKLENKTLLVKAERNIETENKTETEAGSTIVKQFAINNFERRFTLSDKVNTEKIEVNYKNGILNISIPKKEEAKPETIEFSVN